MAFLMEYGRSLGERQDQEPLNKLLLLLLCDESNMEEDS